MRRTILKMEDKLFNSILELALLWKEGKVEREKVQVTWSNLSMV